MEGPPPFGRAIDPMLNVIEQRRPDLGRRLRELRERSPEKFHAVLLDALMLRLETVLNEEVDDPTGGRLPRPGGEGPAPEHPGQPPERVRDLEQKQVELERRSRELSEKLRGLAVDSPERKQGREELQRVLNEQFEVRSNLRRFEIERVERELGQLRAAVERLRADLATREKERAAVIERRMEQLIGEKASDW